jgi:Replication-relaxation
MEVNRLRAVTGEQLERLCFAQVAAGRSRTATRSRALGRLVRWRVLAPVGRRIGGSQRGSSAQAYALDRVGQRLLHDQQLAAGERVRVRRPVPPGQRAISHVLAVAELYASLVEQARGTDAVVAEFAAEPGAHWPNGLGGWLKPDGYAVLERPGVRDRWWIEADMATESLPVIRTKLQAYLDFHKRGGQGPGEVMPWVLVATVSERRRDAIRRLVAQLPEADGLVQVVTLGEAAATMLAVLRE